MTATDAAPPPVSPPADRPDARKAPWRHALVRRLLYGRDVDRAVKAKARLGLTVLVFALGYAAIAGRLVMFAAFPDGHLGRRSITQDAVATARPDVLDRNGEILATDVRAPSLFGEPNAIVDVDEATELLTGALPDLNAPELRRRLASKRRFVWLKRDITPSQRAEIYKLGIPGIGFLPENKRVYPEGAEVSHVVGYVDVDNQGKLGIEKWIDDNGLAALHEAGLASDRSQEPVQLALDVRVQHALRDELIKAKEKYKTLAAAGVIIAVRTGEIVAMVSVPDYDPDNPGGSLDQSRINRLTAGVYEMGSTFKAFTLAMALDSGKVNLSSSFDARAPLQYGKFVIHDTHPEGRFLSIPEIFTYSSNIGAARVAMAMGVEQHQAFLKKMGQLDRLRTEMPESREPQVPRHWGELNTITIAFGHGLSVAPLQAMMGICALMNGGYLIPPTFLRRSEEQARAIATRVVKRETSDKMRYLMRLNVEKGTARQAEVPGYYIGGKTGTSEKVFHGRYVHDRVLNSFEAVLPADDPRYVLLIMLDEPQPLPETQGYRTSGWNAVPTAGAVVARVAPLLGLQPRFDLPPADQLILATTTASR
jgi:cell division protein FtsI (penicillin-binding protein 3)